MSIDYLSLGIIEASGNDRGIGPLRDVVVGWDLIYLGSRSLLELEKLSVYLLDGGRRRRLDSGLYVVVNSGLRR